MKRKLATLESSVKTIRKKAKLSSKKLILKPSSELKFFDSSNNSFTCNLAGSVVSYTDTSLTSTTSTGSINQVVQGDTEVNRNGRQIIIKSVELRGYIDPNLSTLDFNIVNLYLIQDKQCNGALPAFNDIFITIPSANRGNRFPQVSNKKRFKILKKWHIPLSSTNNSIATPGAPGVITFYAPIHVLDSYIKCNIPIEYDSSVSTGAIASVKSNNLLLVACDLLSEAILTINVRIRFTDA